MHSGAVWRRAILALGAVALILAVWTKYGEAKVTILVSIFGVVGSVLPWLPGWPWRWLFDPPQSRPTQVDQAAEALGRSVKSQWSAERNRRRLEDAAAMPIRWSAQGGL